MTRRSHPKKTIGLALSGGSIKGFAHIGVLRRLEELGVCPSIISGTSSGALVGALYSDGYSPKELLDLLSTMSLMGMTVFRPWRTGGILDTQKFATWLRKHLHHERLEDLPIPVRIVATDLDRGEAHIFTEGDLASIIVASCSIPVLFCPVEIEGVTYVDGGLFRNFPASIIRDECDWLIGMNLDLWVDSEYKTDISTIAERSWQLIFKQNTLPDKAVCDVLLESIDVLGYKPFDVEAGTTLEHVGYDIACAETLLPSQE